MVEPHRSNFRLITTNFLGVRIFRKFMVNCLPFDWTHNWMAKSHQSNFRIITATCEPPHVKTNNVAVRPAKTQISLGIRPVWSESSLCAQWVAKDTSFLHADSEDWSDWADAQADLSLHWRTATLLVLSWGGSCNFCRCPNFPDFLRYLLISFQLTINNFDFFPLNRALSLENEEDSEERKIEQLQQQVDYLVAKMKEQVQ